MDRHILIVGDDVDQTLCHEDSTHHVSPKAKLTPKLGRMGSNTTHPEARHPETGSEQYVITHWAESWHAASNGSPGAAAPPPSSSGLPAETRLQFRSKPIQTGRKQITPPATTDEQSLTRSPHHAQRATTQTGSDGGSLDVRFGMSTLDESKNGKVSTTHTQRSSLHKRSGDEMQGLDLLPQSDSRPAKQRAANPPTSSSRSHPGQSLLSGAYLQTRAHVNDEVLSPTTTSPGGIAGHYHPSLNSAPNDLTKENSSPVSTSPAKPVSPHENVLLKQPATRPITEQQLINEVKGIYAGLVMVEKKCVEIVAQQSQSTKRLSDQQWRALVALHRTLLQEHHDFFSASQHPTASETLKKLAIKYAMPARMWRHGIHAFLELLRHRLPDSMEHMLSFIYLSYSMMALLKESVPTFVETWIECLGDLARYRMAIEDTDPRDREIWSGVARMWYNEAADKSPNVGRIQHHLAVLARPNIIEQLFYYDKALITVAPFVNARESIMLLFDMFLKSPDAVQARYPPTEYVFVNNYAHLFTRRSPSECLKMLELFKNSFGGHMDRAGARFKLQGPQIATAMFAGLLDFGKEDSFLWTLYSTELEAAEARRKEYEGHPDKFAASEPQLTSTAQREYWTGSSFNTEVRRVPLPRPYRDQDCFEGSESVASVAARFVFQGTTAVASRMGDKNCVPFMHVVLAIVWDMSFVPGALAYIEACIPWAAVILFLNTLGRSGVSYVNTESESFPPSHGGNGRQLPEDFVLRGLMTTRHYYEPKFFSGQLVDEDERTIEMPSHQAPRAERCLYLGVRLASLGRYITYDYDSKMFDTTEFARTLATTYV